MTLTKLVVQQRPGGPIRPARQQEVCRHVFVEDTGVSSGGRRPYRCIKCPYVEWRQASSRSAFY